MQNEVNQYLSGIYSMANMTQVNIRQLPVIHHFSPIFAIIIKGKIYCESLEEAASRVGHRRSQCASIHQVLGHFLKVSLT